MGIKAQQLWSGKVGESQVHTKGLEVWLSNKEISHTNKDGKVWATYTRSLNSAEYSIKEIPPAPAGKRG